MKDFAETLTYNGKKWKLVFNINVMEEIQAEYGSMEEWANLTSKKEPDAKALIFGFKAMLNEGIDIANEENGTNDPFLTNRQVGRLITGVGMAEAASKMRDTVVGSTEPEEKNG